jgi:cyclopropane fatty-acyl-phospholipid synthase-like methyltransferase
MNNSFLDFSDYAIYNPGTLEMALPVVEATGIKPGMRVLELGAGSGKISCILAKHWNVTVITLEPWSDGADIQTRAEREGVWDRVISMKLEVQHLPFSRSSFDAAIAFGTLEMIGMERPIALEQVKRVLKPGSSFGIGEAMNLDVRDPTFEFDTLEQNRALFEHHGFEVTDAKYFEHGYQWWLDNANRIQKHDEHERMVRADAGRSLSLGMIVGRKPQEE